MTAIKKNSAENSMIILSESNQSTWDNYVFSHPASNPYQSLSWQRIIQKAYGLKVYALTALANDSLAENAPSTGCPKGILPLVHMKSPGFGSRLISMPYVDHGGVLANSAAVERQLIQAAIRLGLRLRVKRIELRHLNKITTLDHNSGEGSEETDTLTGTPFHIEPVEGSLTPSVIHWSVKSHKVRMILPIGSDSATLMKSFKSKLRSQISRPVKAGMVIKIGGTEQLEDFYHVFSINMRDLGSPVHAKALPRLVLEHLRDTARIAVVYKANVPVAASLMVGFKEVMINPWSSALRQYSKDSPNMLLYWGMLAYAADHGYKYFDFGRSTPGEGTYRFKSQWGAQPQPMYWYIFWLRSSTPLTTSHKNNGSEKRRAMVAAAWSRLPVFFTRIIGPIIRKHIDL